MRVNPVHVVGLARDILPVTPIQKVWDTWHSQLRVPSFDVDMSADTIILWVPGTSNHHVHGDFEKAVEEVMPGASIHLVDYMATWKFSLSVPSGIAKLIGVLDYVLKHRRKGQRIVLAGESQGAWIISEVLMKQKYYKEIDKAVLLGHPDVADKHFVDDKKVLEINNDLDVASMSFDANKEELRKAVEKIVSLDLTSIPFWLRFIKRNPESLAVLGWLGLTNIHVVEEVFGNPHDYGSRMKYAALWLNDSR